MGKNAGVKVIAQTVWRRRFILARRKNSSRRMQGEEIYYSETEGEDDLSHIAPI